MKTEATIATRRYAWLVWIGAALAALALGGVAAWYATREPPLLGDIEHVVAGSSAGFGFPAVALCQPGRYGGGMAKRH